MTFEGSWRMRCIAVAKRLNAPEQVFKRIDQYCSDEPGYDDPVWPEPEQFVKEEMDNLKENA